jgi:hypothetical protein
MVARTADGSRSVDRGRRSAVSTPSGRARLVSIGSVILGSLALISVVSMLLKRPWTTVLARRSTPPEVWSTDLFLETNMIITGAWAALFFVAALLASYAPTWVNVAFGALLLVLGLLSSRFGSWYASRRLEAMGLSAASQPAPSTPDSAERGDEADRP